MFEQATLKTPPQQQTSPFISSSYRHPPAKKEVDDACDPEKAFRVSVDALVEGVLIVLLLIVLAQIRSSHELTRLVLEHARAPVVSGHVFEAGWDPHIEEAVGHGQRFAVFGVVLAMRRHADEAAPFEEAEEPVHRRQPEIGVAYPGAHVVIFMRQSLQVSPQSDVRQVEQKETSALA